MQFLYFVPDDVFYLFWGNFAHIIFCFRLRHSPLLITCSTTNTNIQRSHSFPFATATSASPGGAARVLETHLSPLKIATSHSPPSCSSKGKHMPKDTKEPKMRGRGATLVARNAGGVLSLFSALSPLHPVTFDSPVILIRSQAWFFCPLKFEESLC